MGIEKNGCYIYACRLLARSPKTVCECIKKLQEKGFARCEIDETITKLSRRGVLDDGKYVELTIQSEIVRKGKNPFLIQSKLRQKGVSVDIIRKYFSLLEEDIEYGRQEKLQKLIQKLHQRAKSEQEIIRSCLRQGFSLAHIRDEYEKCCSGEVN